MEHDPCNFAWPSCKRNQRAECFSTGLGVLLISTFQAEVHQRGGDLQAFSSPDFVAWLAARRLGEILGENCDGSS